MSDPNDPFKEAYAKLVTPFLVKIEPESREEVIRLAFKMFELGLNQGIETATSSEVAERILEKFMSEFDLRKCEGPKCTEIFGGRSDKKYCSPTCKTNAARARDYDHS